MNYRSVTTYTNIMLVTIRKFALSAKRAAALLLLLAFSLLFVISADTQLAYAAGAPAVSAESVIVMSGSTDEIIYSSHDERKLPVDSSVRIMVAMVVIDNMNSDKEYDAKVEITEEVDAKGDLFALGEKVTVRDLMYAMLMSNSDEAAAALAIYSTGAESACINQMNAKAQQLRLSSTKYENLTGEYSEYQYASAKDISELMISAQRYKMIADILGVEKYELAKTNKHEAREIKSQNPLLAGENAYNGMAAGMVGAVNGGYTYIGSAYVDDMNMIVVMQNEKEDALIADATALLNYGYENVTKSVIVKKGKEVGKVKVRHGAETRVKAYTARRGYVYVPPEGSEALVTTQAYMFSGVKAPLKAGDKVGEYRIYVAGELKGAVDLVVDHDVKTGWFPSYIYISNTASIVLLIALLLIIAIFARYASSQRKKAKAKKRKRQEEIRKRALQEKAIEDDRAKRNWTYGTFDVARPLPLNTTQHPQSKSKQDNGKNVRH